MSFSSDFPYYGQLGRGKYHVSLAKIGGASNISSSIGLTSNASLSLPNTSYLQRFIQGDLGISDSLYREMMMGNLRKVDSMSPKVKDHFLSLTGTENLNDIRMPDSMSFTGLKAFEKSVFQSIFQTQLPFIEIVQLILSSMESVEDVIARIMPLFGNPLKTKSKKPVGNAGNESRPQAIGYRGGVEIKEALKNLSSVINTKFQVENSGISDDNSLEKYKWKIVSSVYSTGKFDPKVNYVYTFIDLPKDIKGEPVVEPIENEHEYKPKVLIFGVYNSNGSPADLSKHPWLVDNPKWRTEENWGVYNTPNYVWTHRLTRKTIISDRSPGSGYSIKKYVEGDKNILTGEDAIVGNDMIHNLQTDTSYQDYFFDLINANVDKTDLSLGEKAEIKSEAIAMVELESQIENIYNYAHVKSTYNNLPSGFNMVYKPQKIYIPESVNSIEPLSSQEGYVWIDPESDYDLKVIRIQPRLYTDGDRTNAHLKSDEPFINSPDFYGHGSDEKPQSVGVINRYTTPSDDDVYYIVEGILKEDNKAFDEVDEQSGGGWYRISHALGIGRSFGKLLVRILTKLIPKIKSLLKLFKSPHEFITTILSEVLGRNFDFLSSDSMRSFSSAMRIKDALNFESIKTLEGNLSSFRFGDPLLLQQTRDLLSKRKEVVKQLRSHFKYSQLSNYVYVDDNGEFITPIDGVGMIPFQLLGKDLTFGVSLKVLSEKPITLIFKNNISKGGWKNISYFNSKYPSDVNQMINDIQNSTSFTNIYSEPNSSIEVKFEDGTTRNLTEQQLTVFENEFRHQYNFVYLTEYEYREIVKVDEYLAYPTQSNLDLARNTLDALPSSDVVRERYNILDQLLDILKQNTNALLKLILGIITVPIKIVAGIIQWIMDFFKSIKNPVKLIKAMKEFLTFEWIKQFVSIDGILEMMGFKNSGNITPDLSQFISSDFTMKLPKYNLDMMGILGTQPFSFNSFKKLIQEIINAIINFIWSLFGIEAVKKPSYLKFDLTNNTIASSGSNVGGMSESYVVDNGESSNDKFKEIFEVQISTGEQLTFNSIEELNLFISKNKNISFSYNN